MDRPGMMTLRLGTLILVACGSLAGCDGVLRGPTPQASSASPAGPSTPGVAPAAPTPLPPGEPTQPADPTPSPPPLPPTGGVWRPAPGTSWQWQLQGPIDDSVDAAMYDIDLFDNTAAQVASLKAQGRVVICYFSAGSFESWRPDAATFAVAARGSKMAGWDEQWLDVRHSSVRDAMVGRLDLAKQKGCDGVEPDNVDGYANNNGFGLSNQDQLDFNRFLADAAHARGLSIGLKNDLEQVAALEPSFDWALNEECLSFDECQLLQPFIDAGKAVFHVEYKGNKANVCPATQSLGFDTLLKKLDVDAWFEACW